MTTLVNPGELVKNDRVRNLLDWPLDFRVLDSRRSVSGYQIIGAGVSEVIAEDGAGGEFVLCGDAEMASALVVHVTSEGAAGVVGANLGAFLGMLVALPCWRDVLKFSGRGTLEIMRRSHPKIDAEYRASQPNIDDACKEVTAQLRLAVPNDPVHVLHATVEQLSAKFRIAGPDGEFESLFGQIYGEYKPHIK